MTPQAKQIYTYMMQGNKIDRKIAMAVFNVQNLTARIAELKKLGISIDTRKVGHTAFYIMQSYDRNINLEIYPVKTIEKVFTTDYAYRTARILF